jgi:hypothetical protein
MHNGPWDGPIVCAGSPGSALAPVNELSFAREPLVGNSAIPGGLRGPNQFRTSGSLIEVDAARFPDTLFPPRHGGVRPYPMAGPNVRPLIPPKRIESP